MANFTETLLEDDFIVKVIHPSVESNQVLLALHGWTGVETTMSIFTERIGNHFWVFQPRGFFPADPEGFSWVDHKSGKINAIQDFIRSAKRLHDIINPMIRRYCLPKNNTINLVGFSQGAAMSIAYSLAYPEEINKAAILAGFLPTETDVLPLPPGLSNINFFISHGTEDTVITIDKARKAVEYLNKSGAAISYCEGRGGHRVSAECFKDLSEFFNL